MSGSARPPAPTQTEQSVGGALPAATETEGHEPTGESLETWHVGQRVLEEFVLERLLGRGGMGEVFLARSRISGSRYAVKRTLVGTSSAVRAFRRELEAWLSLPRHPHIVQCYFVRTTNAGIAIFSEVVECGSLGDRIVRNGALSLADTYDAATQLAWALSSVHHLGFVHQDVKPANALQTFERQLKLGDFGLARARVTGGADFQGMTPAYCSPEQLRREVLSPATDVWSWAVSVLHMICGEVRWHSGIVAPAVVEELRISGGIPVGLADLLDSCLTQDPQQRANLGDAARILARLYDLETGHPYHLLEPKLSSAEVGRMTRRTPGGVAWQSPAGWRAQPGAIGVVTAGTRSAEPKTRRALLVADLAHFEELIDELEGDARCVPSLAAGLWLDRATVERLLGDRGASRASLNRAHALAGEAGLRRLMGMALCRSALLAAAPLSIERILDQAIEILSEFELDSEAAQDFAKALANKSMLRLMAGDTAGAVRCARDAVAVRTRLFTKLATESAAEKLALGYVALAQAAANADDTREAYSSCESAISLSEKRAAGGGANALYAGVLARTCRARLLRAEGDPAGAAEDCAMAFEQLELVIAVTSDGTVLRVLADACSSLSRSESGDISLRAQQRAAELLENLVHEAGRTSDVNALARAHTRLGALLGDRAQHLAAIEMFGRGLAVFEHLRGLGDESVVPLLAEATMNRANSLRELGRCDHALDDYRRAQDLVDVVAQTSPRDSVELAMACAVQFAICARSAGDGALAGAVIDWALATLSRAPVLLPRERILALTLEQNRGNLFLDQGELEQADDAFVRALQLAESSDAQTRAATRGLRATALANRAAVAELRGNDEASTALWNQVVAAAEDLPRPRGGQPLCRAYRHLSRIAHSAGRADEAMRHMRNLADIAGSAADRIDALLGCAMLSHKAEPERAIGLFQEALREASKASNPLPDNVARGLAEAAERLSTAAHGRGDHAETARRLVQATKWHRHAGQLSDAISMGQLALGAWDIVVHGSMQPRTCAGWAHGAIELQRALADDQQERHMRDVLREACRRCAKVVVAFGASASSTSLTGPWLTLALALGQQGGDRHGLEELVSILESFLDGEFNASNADDLAEALIVLASSSVAKGEPARAALEYERAIEAWLGVLEHTGAGHHAQRLAIAYRGLGALRRSCNELRKARTAFHDCLDIYEALDGGVDGRPFSARRAELYVELGDIYRELENHDDAVVAYTRALRIYESGLRHGDDGLQLAHVCSRIAHETWSQGRYQAALTANERAIKRLRLVAAGSVAGVGALLGALEWQALRAGEAGRINIARTAAAEAARRAGLALGDERRDKVIDRAATSAIAAARLILGG